MKHERYEYRLRVPVEEDELRFVFISEGPQGKILKTVQYTPIDHLTWNLAFGDWNPGFSDFDDLSISNNGDLPKVIATVIATAKVFFDHHPGKLLYIKGSTPRRTRLYSWVIARNYSEFQKSYIVLGRTPKGLETYNRSSHAAYLSFLVARR